MLLTFSDLQRLNFTLEAARRNAIPGSPHYCEATLVDASGLHSRLEAKPKCTLPVGHVFVDGTELLSIDGKKCVKVPLGVHGRAYLAIDPATGEVHCSKCKG